MGREEGFWEGIGGEAIPRPLIGRAFDARTQWIACALMQLALHLFSSLQSRPPYAWWRIHMPAGQPHSAELSLIVRQNAKSLRSSLGGQTCDAELTFASDSFSYCSVEDTKSLDLAVISFSPRLRTLTRAAAKTGFAQAKQAGFVALSFWP